MKWQKCSERRGFEIYRKPKEARVDFCLLFKYQSYAKWLLIGGWVENGEYPADAKALERIVKGIFYENARRYFEFKDL